MIKVLVVDDDEDLLEMVSMMLRAGGMEVQSLASGELLFHTIETWHPDIILMDIYLGNYDGRVLCKKIKAHAQYKMLPVLLYSAGNISIASIAEAGADDFLQKPFDMKTMLNRIREKASIKKV